MSAIHYRSETKDRSNNLKVMRDKSKGRRRKRKLSFTSTEESYWCTKSKNPRKRVSNSSYHCYCNTYSRVGSSAAAVVLPDKDDWSRSRSTASGQYKPTENDANSSVKKIQPRNSPESTSRCWIDSLPQELLLKIFSYLPLGLLLHTIPQVCKRWETLALDWTLWKTVENLTIKSMVISTTKLRTLLRTIPKLKKLELISRNDTEELLHELIKSHQNLEVLKLDRCYRSALQMNILSQTVTSILEFCPKLKTVMLTDTYFHSKTFYKSLAKKFRNIERINVTCTTRSEMDVFVENLKENVSEVEFQRVPMMGRAEGKQIYWGPILGLVVRPIPTSPFHRQYTHDNYPTYAF